MTTSNRPAKPAEPSPDGKQTAPIPAAKQAKHAAAKPAAPATRTRGVGREIGHLAVNVYERGVADFVAFERDTANITSYPWAKNALTASAGLIADVNAVYVRAVRQILR
ncbi:hypothetical protein [Actinoplanes sp. NBRC 101535]|uniref:hypothetical protein n=1 Tax=Actinoplanes sp. NBRC 101535 TaxID=3032196 RepID=UPI0024A5C2AF|nr:hypothetical protein [Actinoplanes sp. NBRC 101535]GLY08742.1 hypothetical protein Acsp01_91210 [Actinoplanes sp. NBRC 101535]